MREGAASIVWGELEILAALVKPVQKALREARVTRKGNSVEAVVTMPALSATTIKKISDALAEQNRPTPPDKDEKPRPKDGGKDK
jgi:hypothetical protein